MWAVSRVCQVSFKPLVKSAVPALKTPITVTSLEFINLSSARHQALRAFRNSRPPRVIQVEADTNAKNAITIGQGALAGAGLVGIGALCYYGLGLSNEEGIIDRAALWPQYVKDRIKTTYMYVGGSVVVSAAAAVVTLRSKAAWRIFASGNFLHNILLLGAFMATSTIVQMVPYTPGIGPKQLGWLAFSSLIGGMVAPLYFYGGPAILRAAWYTAGIVGGLSTVAICAPNDQFLRLGGPLSIGLGLVFASAIGTMFLPPTTFAGASMHSMFMYGGLIIFSGMLLYNTQRIVKAAEQTPPDYNGVIRYDPVNMSMSLFMDIVNIFMRMVFLVGGSNKNRQK